MSAGSHAHPFPRRAIPRRSTTTTGAEACLGSGRRDARARCQYFNSSELDSTRRLRGNGMKIKKWWCRMCLKPNGRRGGVDVRRLSHVVPKA
eukprot:4880505-Alexandrium_andersonii.AAC.1